MAELGEQLLRGMSKRERRFSDVNVTKIIRSEDGAKIRDFLMGAMPFQAADKTIAFKEELLTLNKKLAEAQGHLEKKQSEMYALQKRMENERKQFFEEGYKKGCEKGVKQGQEEAKTGYEESLNQLQERMTGIIQNLSREKSDTFVRLEKDFVSISMVCVSKLFQKIVSECEDGIVPILREAMRAVSLGTVLVLKVNPEDFKTADQQKSLWMPLDREVEGIRLESDNRIHRGSCRLESDNTTVEMNMESIIKRFGDILTKVLQNRLSKKVTLKQTEEPDFFPKKKDSNRK